MPTSRVQEPEWYRWQQVMMRQNGNACTVVTLCGPSGSGKTTAVRTLTDVAAVYLESTAGNPHLPFLLTGRTAEFDATANQMWFLQRMHSFVRSADPRQSIVLDQDPAAIVFAYSQLWRASGQISDLGFSDLLNELIELEQSLQRWRTPRITVFLDASPDTLHDRVVRRDESTPAPPPNWFQDVRTHFRQLRTRMPHSIDCTGSIAEVSEIGRRLLKHQRLANKDEVDSG